jgi:tripartite-type tricarboxylate transporter receptor subunit TctC
MELNERIALGVMLAVLLGAPASQVQGQPAFDRPITMVVPLSAGGTADLLCRLAAERAGPVVEAANIRVE